jgi:photosystem II stability/assembly factor-like uncharacterized protein
MNKRILIIVALQLFLTLNSCSSDSGDNPVTTPEQPPVVVVKTAKITSYSKNYGETGETIKMFGENFSDKVSDIKITFDGVVTTVVSATVTEITFTLPSTEKVLPKLELTVENRTISNEVKNDYQGNIGILPVRNSNEWVAQENTVVTAGKENSIQMFSDKIVYVGGVFKTIDGGVSWTRWALSGLSSAYHVTINDEGWTNTLSTTRIAKVQPGGSLNDDVFANIETGHTYYCMYVDANMKYGTVVTQSGKVFTTSNGVDFVKAYQIGDDTANLFNSTKIDNNHIWAIGYKNIKNNEGTYGNRPFILYKNNTTDGWKEYPFINESWGYYARQICFVDNSTGFLLINKYYNTLLDVKIFKTTNGGDSWNQVYNSELFEKFTFKDANIGWATLGNKIYKTTTGGSTWTLDYTHDQSISNISYKNNVVWAFSLNKIIKRYL